MTFEEWWYDKAYPYTDRDCAESAYEAGVQEGINRMYLLYEICPECKEANGRHQMNCGRGR